MIELKISKEKNQPEKLYFHLENEKIPFKGLYPNDILENLRLAGTILENNGYIGSPINVTMPQWIYDLLHIEMTDFMRKKGFADNIRTTRSHDNKISVKSYSVSESDLHELEIIGYSVEITDIKTPWDEN